MCSFFFDSASAHREFVYALNSGSNLPAVLPGAGYGVNTFKLVTKEGKETLVKFHMYPKGGAEFMTDEQAQAAGEKNMRHRCAPDALLPSGPCPPCCSRC